MRLKIFRIIIIVLFVIVALDLFYIQFIRGGYFYNLSKNNRIRIVPLEGWRGRIRDRNGRLLADNVHSYNVMITPQGIKDEDKLFYFLGDVLKIDQQELLRKYRRGRLAPFAPVIVAEDIPRKRAIILEENKYLFSSLIVQESYKRFYPTGENSSHVLGYVGKINRSKLERFKEYGYSVQSLVGYSGVEEYYDSYLRGEEGGLQIEVNNHGHQVRLLSIKEPTKGQDITLTIDSAIQEVAQELLDGKKGAIVVMDIDNGEILGLVSSPAYDPNIFVGSKRRAKRRRMSAIFSNKASPLLNRAITGLFPPGSVFKVPVALAALESGKITQYTSFDCKGFLELGGTRFGCAHVHGSQNLIEAIAHSCNVYFYHLGLISGEELINKYACLLNLGTLTHIDLPYEKSGLIPSRSRRLLLKRRRWYAGDTLNFSIGQGDVLTTPIQLVRMMATVAREGSEVQPHLIKSIGGSSVDEYSFERNVKISAESFETVKKGLRASVTEFSGTAHVLNLNELYVAGKTGTAQSSGTKKDHAWFVGYAVGEERNISVCVFLEHGGSSHNACLVTRDLLLEMYKNKKI